MSSDGDVSQVTVDKVAVGGDSIVCTTFENHDDRSTLWMTTVIADGRMHCKSSSANVCGWANVWKK